MRAWHRTERITSVLSVVYSKDLDYKIQIFKERSDLYWGDLVDIDARKILITRGWHSKSELIAYLKKWLDLKQDNAKITQKKAVKPKKEATLAKRKTKRRLTGNALKQKAYSLLKKGTHKIIRKRGKNTNTRYVRKKAVGVYIYELKPRKK